MSTEKIVETASGPEFYARVAFIALKVAQEVAAEKKGSNSEARLAYANRVFRGDDNAILLAAHVVASSKKLQDALLKGEVVSDSDIEHALENIWSARANAFMPERRSADG